MTTIQLSQAVLDVLNTFPEKEREEALEAISTKSYWKQKIKPFFEGIPMHYIDDGQWESFLAYPVFCVTEGVLTLTVLQSYPCGDEEWSDQKDDCVIVDENYDKNASILWQKLNEESEESVKTYEQWVEDEGKDPLDRYRYWLIDYDDREQPDLNDRFQVSLQIWYVNQGIYPNEMEEKELLSKIRERFAEGFRSTLRIGHTVIEYPLKYCCDRPMHFQADPPEEITLCDDSIYEPFTGWVCKKCGNQIQADNDQISWRETGDD